MNGLAWLCVGTVLVAAGPAGGGRASGIDSWFTPPPQWAGDLGGYRPPLRFEDGRAVTSPADWARRRQEILDRWHGVLGPWPPLIESPEVAYREEASRDGMTQHRVRVEVAPGGRTVDGYLLVPAGRGPYPAVLVVYYDAQTGAGLGKELRDFGYQLARRGFVALSIGTPECRYYPSEKDAQLQPLSMLAYVAANCCNALAQLPQVDGERIGVAGHSYGGKWAMFASCLYDRFACAVWSDPGIVFDEHRPNVNYWEPWYLGYERGRKRRPGVPTPDNPRTGAYQELVERGHDLHELHALMAPRPFLVSGGSEDRRERWKALNHTIAVNRLLGFSNRVAMTNRSGHAPTPESNEQIYRFFERFLKRTEGPEPQRPTGRMLRRRRDHVTLVYSPESEPKAQALLDFAAQCNQYLNRLFAPERPVTQTVYWMTRRDWLGPADSYGFPHARGPDAYLAAADVELPTQLAGIADWMDIDEGGPAVRRIARLLALPGEAQPADVHRQLTRSRDFFFRYSAYFILPHELTHGFCNALGYPQRPRWYYEGIAQWAAYHMQRELRSEEEAELIYAYYQLLWDRAGDRLPVRDFAVADQRGAGGLDTPNYAWYHAGLLRMFRQLEEMKGEDPLPDLVRAIGAQHRHQDRVPPEVMIGTFSEVIGRDLRRWFRDQWKLGAAFD